MLQQVFVRMFGSKLLSVSEGVSAEDVLTL